VTRPCGKTNDFTNYSFAGYESPIIYLVTNIYFVGFYLKATEREMLVCTSCHFLFGVPVG
jgi:hypothetical protein